MYIPEKINPAEMSVDDEIEELLNSTPDSLLPPEMKENFRQRYENEAETDDDVRKIILEIKKIVKFRNREEEFISIDEEGFLANFSSDNIEDIKEKIDEVIRKICAGEMPFLGEGRVGKVFSVEGENLCFKMIMGDVAIYNKENNVKEEFVFMVELADLEIEGVRIPQPIYYRAFHGAHFIVMEALKAVSLEDVLESRESMPEGFKFEIFFEALDAFVAEMNARNIYHLDLSPGNVMVDKETGMPYVIDFGRAKRHVGDGVIKKVIDGQEIVYQLDLDKHSVANLRKEINEQFK